MKIWVALRPGLFTPGEKVLYPLDRIMDGPQRRESNFSPPTRSILKINYDFGAYFNSKFIIK